MHKLNGFTTEQHEQLVRQCVRICEIAGVRQLYMQDSRSFAQGGAYPTFYVEFQMDEAKD